MKNKQKSLINYWMQIIKKKNFIKLLIIQKESKQGKIKHIIHMKKVNQDFSNMEKLLNI